jgi:hypothetical protein
MESTASIVETEPGHFTTTLNPCRLHPGARLSTLIPTLVHIHQDNIQLFSFQSYIVAINRIANKLNPTIKSINYL